MKKQFLLITLLMALFAPLAMNGQQTLVVANGTGTNSEIPFYGLYADDNYQHTQTIYPSSMLTEMEGGTITKLTYHLSSSVTKDYGSTFEVRLGTTSSTSFSTGTVNYISMTGSPAYSNTLSVDGTTVEFNLSTPYTYNGGNLVVDVRISNKASGYSSTSFYGESGSINYSVKNRSTSSLPTSTGTAVTFMPKTTFTYLSTDPYITLAPQTATVLTGFTETLTATYGNVSGTPTITYSSSNTSVATVSGSGTTATVTGVAPGTATITATMNGSYTATCAITVMDACQPTWTSSSYYISNFTVSKSETTLLNNSSTGTGGTTTNYYATQSIMAEPGDELSCVITMSSSSTYGFAMWVDFDQDGLDSDDLITSTSSYTYSPYTITLNIPANASAGEYRMRIWGDYNRSSASDPCGAYANGEAEDYKIIVNAGAYHITCNATTNGTISVDHGSADAGETIIVTAVPETNYELTALSYNDGSDHSISFSNNQGTFTMPAADVTVSATFSIMRNLPPYDLTVGTPGGHSVELGWTGVSTNTNHQSFDLYYSTDPVMPQTPVQSSFIGGITASSYELTGLAPTTTYYAWVRDNCGTDGYSEWVAFTSFTTDVACPAPTNVAANHITNNSAVINWEGNAESYNVRYRTQKGFRYDFESATPWAVDDFSPCTTYDGDGEGTYGFQSWDFPNSGYTGACIAFNNDNEGSSNMYAHGGVAFGVMFDIEGATNDWFILPELTINNGDIFSFWAREITDQYGAEVINVGVCSSNHTFSAYLAQNLNISTTEWTPYSYDLSAYAGQTIQLAINCVSNDIFGFMFDDIFVGNPNDDTWDEVITDASTPLTLSGLDAETDYEVQVQANCGSVDGTSAWVGTTFTTLDNCAVPYELNTTNLTAASATLNWTGAQEAYNVRYHIAGEKLEEGFEGGSLPEGWTKQGSTWTVGQGAGTSTLTSTYEGSYNVKCSHSSTDDDYYLIMPALDLSGASNLNLSLYYANPYYSSSYADDIDGFGVYYRIDEGAWNELFYTTEKHNTWTPLTVALTGLAANYQIGFRMHDNYGGGVAIDNISLVISAGGEWVTKTNVTSPLNINGLTPSSNYEWQVQGVNCDGNGTATDWSATATFTTPEGYTKDIEAYTTNGGYYLIASPLAANISPDNVTNMTSNTYDLYRFNQSNQTEWENYKGHTTGFVLENGKGYLYANSEDVQLVFSGAAYTGTGEIALTQDASNELRGNWNLVGNPYPETANIGSTPYYKMKSDGTDVESTTGGTIAPMEAVFVLYDSENSVTSVTFTPGTGSKANEQLTLNVTQGRSNIDRAIVRFGNDSQLPKFQLFETSTKLYIPQGTQDFAVVNAEAQGEMPVNFKAQSNGTYTVSVNAENVEFNYLHLIDNMTGADIDLLETPSYSFEANTSDYESRFKLVFAQGNNSNNDNFAFVSNEEIIVNGEGLLQMFDVTGRTVYTAEVNSAFRIPNSAFTAGVYVLKLNDKTQKIVLK